MSRELGRLGEQAVCGESLKSKQFLRGNLSSQEQDISMISVHNKLEAAGR